MDGSEGVGLPGCMVTKRLESRTSCLSIDLAGQSMKEEKLTEETGTNGIGRNVHLIHTCMSPDNLAAHTASAYGLFVVPCSSSFCPFLKQAHATHRGSVVSEAQLQVRLLQLLLIACLDPH